VREERNEAFKGTYLLKPQRKQFRLIRVEERRGKERGGKKKKEELGQSFVWGHLQKNEGNERKKKNGANLEGPDGRRD